MVKDTRTVRGAENLKRRLDIIRENTDRTLSNSVLGRLLLQRMRQRFAQRVDPDGVPWPRHAEATLKDSRFREGRRRLLERTGTLRRSIGIIRGLNTGLLATSTGAGLRIGVTDPIASVYGRFHQRGLGNNPQRRFLGIGRGDLKAVDSLLGRDIIRASGLKRIR